MVEITSHDRNEHHNANNFELTEASEVDPDAPQYADSEYTESDKSQLATEAAMHKMKKLAQKIYDTTPGINDSKLATFLVFFGLTILRSFTDYLSLVHSVPEEAIEDSRRYQA